MSLDLQAPVSSLGEDGIVGLLRGRFTAPRGTVGIGDDAAVFPAPGERLVMTTDTLVEGADFSLDYFSGSDLGWKTLAVNVSDLAAMGAEPAHAVATLCLPPTTAVGFVVDLIDGIAEAAARWGVEVVGGDLSSAERISLGITLLGHTEEPVLRSGARPGDALLVTGALGGSAGGLHLLRRDASMIGPLVDRHRRPRPRLELSRLLRKIPVTSMIDLSDGLIVDLRRLVTVSGTGCRVDSDVVPIEPALERIDELDALQTALFGGEDFELLFTIGPETASGATDAGERIGVAVTQIGTVTERGYFLDDTAFDDLEDKAWDHLRSR